VSRAILVARVVFGAWMLVNGANYLFFSLWPTPAGHEPLAILLMAALVHSRLLGVAMFIQLICGALILSGLLVPLALCIVMPISICALYWALILDHRLGMALAAAAAVALNGFLMLAHLESYRGALQRSALALGETVRSSYDTLFASAGGRTSRREFVPALITLLAVAALYTFLVTGRTALWCMVVLLYPGVILHARRLHDMGHRAWLLLGPLVLMILAFAIWLGFLSLGAPLDAAVPAAALIVSAGFALWGCFGRESPRARTAGFA